MRTESTIILKRPLAGAKLVEPGSSTTPIDPDVTSSRAAEQSAQEREAVHRVIEGLVEAVRALEDRKQQLLGEMQEVAVELAIAVASRLIHEKIEKGQFPVEKLVSSAVEYVGTKRPVKIRLNPQDIELLTARLGQASLGSERDPLELTGDAALPRGSCLVETDELSIVSQIEPQLIELRRHLLGNLENAEIERRKPQPGDRNLRRFPDRRQTA